MFIGLGGIGTQAVLHVKARFLSTYGKTPSVVNFMAFDTSDKDKFIVDENGVRIELIDDLEFFHLTVENVYKYIMGDPIVQEEFPLENLSFYKNIVLNQSPSNTRVFGRIPFIRNYEKIKEAINAAFDRVTSWKAQDDDNFVSSKNSLQIYLVFSTAGVSGSGMFLDFAYLLKQELMLKEPYLSLRAFILLPDVFLKRSNVAQVKSNSYAAMKELEFLMDRPFENTVVIPFSPEDVRLKYPGGRETIIDNVNPYPFNRIFLINNKSDTLFLNEPDEICQFIASGIFQLSIAGDDRAYGALWEQRGGSENVFPIDKKIRRYNGLGLCEIVYNGKIVQNLSALVHAKKIIEQLMKSNSDITSASNIEARLNEWNLNEINESGQVVNRILPKVYSGGIAPVEKIGKGKLAEIQSNSAHFLMAYQDQAKKITENNFGPILTQAREAINSYLVDEILHNENAIGTAIEFLSKLIKRFQVFQELMKNEGKGFEDKISGIKAQQESVKAQIQNVEKKTNIPFIHNVDKALELEFENYNNLSRKEAEYFKEKTKRDAGHLFFSSLISEIEARKMKFKSLSAETLSKILTNLDDEINKTLSTHSSLPFTLSLHEKLCSKVIEDLTFSGINEFMHALSNKSLGIEKWTELKSEEIKEVMCEFCLNESESKKWSERVVDDILFHEFPPEEINAILSKALSISVPLWKVDMGKLIALDVTTVIGLNNNLNDASCMLNNPTLKDLNVGMRLLDNNVTYTTTGDPSRIIILQVAYSSPAFTVFNMKDYQNDYLNNLSKEEGIRLNHHANQRLQKLMDRMNFDVFPVSKEIENHAMGAWIIGLLLGYLRKKYEYEFQSPLKRQKENGPDDWFSFETSERKVAFDKFINNQELIEEFFNMKKEWVRENGDDKFKAIMNSLVLTDENGYRSINEAKYFNEYGHYGINIKTLKGNKPYADDLALYGNELNFILSDFEKHIR